MLQHTTSEPFKVPLTIVEPMVEVPENTRLEAGFIHPVLLSSNAWKLIRWRPGEDSHKNVFEPSEDRLWNVLWMAQLAARNHPEAESTLFSARLISKIGGGHYPEITRFILQSFMTEDGRDAVLISLDFED